MRITPEKSQIATILTLVMAVIFLFIVVTINIGNIAQEKTMLSNVSDNAALLLASMLGSLSNGLRMRLGLWGNKEKDCELDFLLIMIIVGAATMVLVAIGTGGLVGVPAFIMFVGSAVTFIGGIATAISEPANFKQAALQFQNMTFEERLKESGVQMALYSMVSDPNKNCVNKPCLTTGGGDPALYGGCDDPYDLDMDGQTKGDCVSCFAYWYTERLKALPRKGDVIQNIFDELFFNPRLQRESGTPAVSGGKLPRIYVKSDEKWEADGYGFWIDTNSNKLADPKLVDVVDENNIGFLSMDYTDQPKNITGVVYSHDIYLVDWLDSRFIPLVKKLNEHGYGLTPKLEDTLNDIQALIEETMKFENELAALYGADFDKQLESFEEWMPIFYNGTPEQDWCDRMQEWTSLIQRWINDLGDRKDAINQCVTSCEARGPYQCGKKTGGEVCEQIYVPKTCTRHIVEWCMDPVTGATYDCGYDEEFDCSYCDPATRWCSCNNGSLLNGGALCPSKCSPTNLCVTPFGQAKNCCEIADNGLYYQLCDATAADPIEGEGNSEKCGASFCRDNFYQCNYDPNNNVITREHAIEYLTQFRDDVMDVIQAFKKGYKEAKLKESDPRFYEALYEWEDYAGRKGEITSQKVKHAVYVRLSDHFKPNEEDPEKGFQIPYPYQYRDWGLSGWLGNKKCTKISKEKGEFGIVVARYDQDVGTLKTAPLRKLWVFKTRAKPSETEPALPFSYIDPSKPVSQEASRFVLENGIVSATRGYYGPGYTYTKEELKTRDPNILKAYEFNRDIKIKRAKWTDFVKY